jgi:membrane protein insertase Oxa1/YidC/SpoIIIJ
VFLYQPLFNGLIWLYNNWAGFNLGWAVIYLTILLRVVLMPLTVIDHLKKVKNQELNFEVLKLQKEFHNDEVLKKQEIRKLLKKRKVNPWAKIASLGIQGLVLVLLYQVFVNGITGEKMMQALYSFVNFPGKVNIMFYGFDLGRRYDFLWAGVVALFLFFENYIEAKKTKRNFRKVDLSYFVLFPAVVFYLLWILPMVKSLFVLTSMLFSIIVGMLLNWFVKPHKPKDA